MNLDWNCHLIIYSWLESVNGQLSWDVLISVMRFHFCHSISKANPRIGHLKVVYHVFVHLKNHFGMGWIAHDSLNTPEINESAFHSGNWSEFYGNVHEEMPPKMAAKSERKSGNYLCIC
jgi:hypothetical protein